MPIPAAAIIGAQLGTSLLGSILGGRGNKWNQNTMSELLSYFQGQGIPQGEAWNRYLQLFDPLSSIGINGIINPNLMLWGSGGGDTGMIPGFNDNLQNWLSSIPGLYDSSVGNYQGSNNNILSQILNFSQGQQGKLDDIWNRFGINGASADQQNIFDTYSNYLANGPMGMRGYQDVLDDIFKYRGGTAHTANAQDTMGALLSNLGLTGPMQQGIGAAGDILSLGGYTNNLNQGINSALGLLSQGNNNPMLTSAFNSLAGNILSTGGATPFTQGGLQGASNLINNPNTTQSMLGTGFAGNLLGNNGLTPQLNQAFNTAFSEYGNQVTPALGNLQNTLAQTLQGGGFDRLGPAYGALDQLMSSGGISDMINQGFGQSMNFAQGRYPDLFAGLPSSVGMPNFPVPTISAGGGGGGVSAPSMGTGLTPELERMLQLGMKGLEENPLLPFQQAISFARDQAGGDSQKAFQAALQRAVNRGVAPGVLGSSIEARALLEGADQGAQIQSQALREAALGQQGLQLQRSQQQTDAAKIAQQIAAQRAAAQLQAETAAMSENAASQRQAAAAQTQAAIAQAQLQGQMTAAQANFLSNIAGLNAQRQLGGLQSALGFSDQANQRLLQGINSYANLGNTANDRFQSAIQGILGGEQISAGRAGNALDLLGQLSGVQGGNIQTGLGSLSNFGQQGMQGILGGLDAIRGITGSETDRMSLASIIPSLVNSGTQQFGTAGNLLSNLEGIGTQNRLGALDSLLGFSNAGTNSLNTAGNILLGANRNDTDRLLGGLGASSNYGNLMASILNNNQNAVNSRNQYSLGLGDLALRGWGLGSNDLNNLFSNNNTANNFSLNFANSRVNAQNQGFNQYADLLRLLSGNQNNMFGNLTNLANPFMSYMGGAVQSIPGLFGRQGTTSQQQGGVGNWLTGISGNLSDILKKGIPGLDKYLTSQNKPPSWYPDNKG